MDVYAGWPGRVHNAKLFANSSLFHRGQTGNLFPEWTKQIFGKQIPIVILGDPAYPWFMKAFPNNGCLTHLIDLVELE